MRPIKELSQLRTAKLASWDKNLTQKTLLCEGEKQAELELTLDSADFSLTLNDPKTSAQIKLSFDQKAQTFILENGDKRYATIAPKSKLKLQLFIDTSSLEIFINDGEAVFTERFYFEKTPEVWLDTRAKCDIQLYRLGKAITFDKH